MLVALHRLKVILGPLVGPPSSLWWKPELPFEIHETPSLGCIIVWFAASTYFILRSLNRALRILLLFTGPRCVWLSSLVPLPCVSRWILETFPRVFCSWWYYRLQPRSSKPVNLIPGTDNTVGWFLTPISFRIVISSFCICRVCRPSGWWLEGFSGNFQSLLPLSVHTRMTILAPQLSVSGQTSKKTWTGKSPHILPVPHPWSESGFALQDLAIAAGFECCRFVQSFVLSGLANWHP